MSYPRLVDFVVYGRELVQSEKFGVSEESFGSFLGSPYHAESKEEAREEMSRRLERFAQEQESHNKELYERHKELGASPAVLDADTRVLQFGFIFDAKESSAVLDQSSISNKRPIWGEGFGVVTQAIIGDKDLSTIQMGREQLNVKMG